MPRLRRGVELGSHELDWLVGALTVEQRYALIDSGWNDDLGAAVDFVCRRSADARLALEARLERTPAGWEDGWWRFCAVRFWDAALPLLEANRPEPPLEAATESATPAAGDDPAEESGETGQPGSRPRPRLPNSVKSFPHGTLEKAVKAFAGDATRGATARAAKMPQADARRVRLMFREELLRLNPAGKLIVDDRVALQGSRYVLRYLDDTGTRWLDPIRELQGR